MLQNRTANLPQEQQQRLHADFLANEQAYLQMRDSLLPCYRGQWVAIHAGKVIAAGADLRAVTEAASASGGHPYIALVGAEDQVVFRVRQVGFVGPISRDILPTMIERHDTVIPSGVRHERSEESAFSLLGYIPLPKSRCFVPQPCPERSRRDDRPLRSFFAATICKQTAKSRFLVPRNDERGRFLVPRNDGFAAFILSPRRFAKRLHHAVTLSPIPA